MDTDDAGGLRGVNLTKKFRSGGADLVVFRGPQLRSRPRRKPGADRRIGRRQEHAAVPAWEVWTGLPAVRYTSVTRTFPDFSDTELAEFRNREIGFVWQNHSLLPEFTALENVMMPLLIRGARIQDAEPASLARLDEVGLRNRASHRAGELSGGEQQRVALARALAGNPAVLLADEPTGNLDFRTGEMIISLLEDLHRSHQLTSIFVTHNLSFAARCDRVLQLDKGDLTPWSGRQ